MTSQNESPETLNARAAALKRYRELQLERDALARNIEWLRSQLPTEYVADGPSSSDLLFLADYARKERHITVRNVNNEKPGSTSVFELAVQQRMEKMSTVVWPSGCVLAEVVANHFRELCGTGASILELGCGTAVPSIVAAAQGAHVLATDADVASADLVIAQNCGVLATAGGSISTAVLKWGAPVPQKPWAAILVADAIYAEEHHASLATTLASASHVALAAGAANPPQILLAYQVRRPAIEARFFDGHLRERRLQWKDFPLTSIPLSDDLRSCIRVLEVSLAEESKPLKKEILEGIAI